jgi:prepilin-type N-terminal cleavage/methylation domain-containing protein
MIMNEKGFTIIELIMTMLLAAILAAVAVPYLFRGQAPLTVPAFARKVADDIRHSQSLAMLRGGLDTPETTNPYFLYRIRFNVPDANCPGASHYTIVNDADNNGTWGENPNGSGQVESGRLSSTGSEYFCVSMESGDYAGFTISADFGGTIPGVLSFDSLGVPLDSDGAALTSSKTVTVSRGGESALITVTPKTGFTAAQ